MGNLNVIPNIEIKMQQKFGKTDLAKQMMQQENLKIMVSKQNGDAFKPWKNENAKIQATPFGNWKPGEQNKKFNKVEKDRNTPNNRGQDKASMNISIFIANKDNSTWIKKKTIRR